MLPHRVPSRLLSAASFVVACAWPAAASRQATSEDYSKEPLVLEHNIVKVAFDTDGTETRDVDISARVQSAAGVQEAGTLTLPYSREFATIDVKYIRSRKPDGTVVETPPSSAIDLPADITRVAPTYTDV